MTTIERRHFTRDLRLPELPPGPPSEPAGTSLRAELTIIANCTVAGIGLGLLLVAIVLFIRAFEVSP